MCDWMDEQINQTKTEHCYWTWSCPLHLMHTSHCITKWILISHQTSHRCLKSPKNEISVFARTIWTETNMLSIFIHRFNTATVLHHLTGMFSQKFGGLKSHFRTKVSCKATSISRIIGAGFDYITLVSSFPWRPTSFRRSCVGLLKPAKYKIKNWVVKKVTSLSMRIRNIVLVLCMEVRGQGGWVRSKMHVGPTVLIHLKALQHINSNTFGLS